VAGGQRRRTRNLCALHRALDKAADDRLGAAGRCIEAAGTPRPAPTTGSILPIGAISRSRVSATSAASVQVVVRFPPDTTLEVNVYRPDGSLVPGFNGPSPFPATLRTDARGDARGLYGIVRGTSPTGTWKVVVNVAGRPDLGAARTFRVID